MRRWICLLLLGGLALGFRAEAQELVGVDTPPESFTPQERLALVQAAVTEMEQAADAVDGMFREAQLAGKAELARCLNAALGPIRVLRDIGKLSANSFQVALAADDRAHSDLEFRKIIVARDKVREHLSRALICGGVPPGPTTAVTQSNVVITPDQVPEVEAAWEDYPSPGTTF